METFTYTCVLLKNVCKHNNLDFEDVLDKVASSDVSFGNNEDSLITIETLEDILGKKLDFGGLDDSVLVSVGP